MQAHHSSRRTTQRRTPALSPKEILRAHVDRLSPAQQRAFIATALEMIAAHTMLDEIEDTLYRLQPSPTLSHTVNH